MSLFKLELPSNDPIALKAFANALLEMSLAHSSEAAEPVVIKLPGNIVQKEIIGTIEDLPTPPITLPVVEETLPTPPITLPVVEETLPTPPITLPIPPVIVDNVDLETGEVTGAVWSGVPWDKRIHSKTKTQNVDCSFKLRKRPGDMEKPEWNAYVEVVKAELTHLTPPVVPVNIPTPPVVVTPPVNQASDVFGAPEMPKSFGELMKFVTSNSQVLTPTVSNQVLVEHGIAKWPLLAVKLAAEPEFMKVIYPALEAKL